MSIQRKEPLAPEPAKTPCSTVQLTAIWVTLGCSCRVECHIATGGRLVKC